MLVLSVRTRVSPQSWQLIFVWFYGPKDNFWQTRPVRRISDTRRVVPVKNTSVVWVGGVHVRSAIGEDLDGQGRMAL